MSFEENLVRLNEIVSCLEKDDMPLGDAVKLFEEGQNLAKFCMKDLEKAKGKVTILKDELDEIIQKGDND